MFKIRKKFVALDNRFQLGKAKKNAQKYQSKNTISVIRLAGCLTKQFVTQKFLSIEHE